MASGSGCSGTAGTPNLGAPVLPIVGTGFQPTLTSLPTRRFTFAVLFIGVNKTALPLDVMGMTGCSMLTAPLFELPVMTETGQAQWTLPIPLDANLVGSKVRMQGFETDPPANVGGIVNSNGVEATIG